MKETIIYQMPHIYRDDFRVMGYTFGRGEKALCIVGAMRGNEYQQIFMCARMIQRLKKLEAEGRLVEGQQICVIPSVNPGSMNIGKRFWSIDNTDINRMFPGYDLGETTQRIAAGVFEVVNKYRSGIQFTSFYTPGDYQPHVRIMHTGFENLDKAQDFGLPYIVIRQPKPFDTTTLNYNWQIWETDAYSVYSNTTTRIDPACAEMVADGIERFMILGGILKGEAVPAPAARVVRYEDLLNVRTMQAGLYESFTPHNSRVTAGQKLAQIIDPCTGDILEELYSPADGLVFFQHNEPLIFAHTCALKILQDE